MKENSLKETKKDGVSFYGVMVVLQKANGSKIRSMGQYVLNHNLKSLQGRYIWTDGRIYEGEWMNQKLHGVGIYKWRDGKIYKGEYSNDKKHGFGIYTLQDGRTYEGWWCEGKQHGIGTFIF